jgi:hypothetical protein
MIQSLRSATWGTQFWYNILQSETWRQDFAEGAFQFVFESGHDRVPCRVDLNYFRAEVIDRRESADGRL